MASANSKRRHDRVFAIGDVHGCAVELEALLARIKPRSGDLVVFLGDYVDRGPQSRLVVDIILDLGRDCEVVALKGNHEAMFLDFLDHPESVGAGLFVLNGGSSTLVNYTDASSGAIELPEAHLQFFRGLKLFHETDTHFFVHAGVPDRPLDEIDPERDAMALLWSRHPFLGSRYPWKKMIVHGHTPVNEVEVRPNRINVDTGCVYGRKLTALELPSGVFHQIDRGEKNPKPIYPRDNTPSARDAKRFLGRIPMRAWRFGEAPARFQTLNYNQFGLLMQIDAGAEDPEFEVGEKIHGQIGPDAASALCFEGEIVRCETRGPVAVYGVRILHLQSEA